jgi:hypothetical protein
MVITISIRNLNDLKKVDTRLKYMSTAMRKVSHKVMSRWGPVLVRDLKASASRNTFEGDLQKNGINWVQKPHSGELHMSLAGIYLDSMNPHWVNIQRNRPKLLRWARRAQNTNIKKAANAIAAGRRQKYGIFVKKHPFINAGYRLARPKLTRMLKAEMDKVTKKNV